MKKRYTITPETDEQIRRAYQNEVGMGSCSNGDAPVRALAERLNLPRWKVTRQAITLGLVAKQKKEPDWSERELGILERSAHRSPRAIQSRLKRVGMHRSETAIILKRKRMRFLQSLNGQSATSLAECFGVDAKTVRRWILNGHLKAKKRGTERTEKQGGDMWRIKEKDVRRFLVEHVCEIDFRKLDKYWLVDILTGSNGK